MADFCLNEQGEIVLSQFGEIPGTQSGRPATQSSEIFWRSQEVTDDAGCSIEGAEERVRKAVEYENTRLWEDQPKDEPKTELGKKIAGRMGTSAVVANHYVELAAERILKSADGEDGKPN